MHECDPADVAEAIVLKSAGWSVPTGDVDTVWAGEYFDPIRVVEVDPICQDCARPLY